ncbi:histidine phosphatase family protein [bacterium]|nr:histidine phosphatase family protein [bacterium]
MTTLVIVRHGHTALNREGPNDTFRGTTDTPLDERGLREAKITADAVAARWKPSAIYSSTVPRAMVTAQIIAKSLSLPVIPEPGLLDMNYGAWTGLTMEEVRPRWPELIDTLLNRPGELRAPGGDSMQAVRKRAIRAIKRIAVDHEGETVVLVTHTLVIRLILLGIMGLPTNDFFRIRQDTCAINVLQKENGVFYLALVNDSCHIREAQQAT